MWREFNLINSFTLETTFCGPTDGRYQDCHFTASILKDCGRLFCKTLLDYASNEPKVREAIRELETMFPPQKAEEGLSQHFNQNPSEDTNHPRNRGQNNMIEDETTTTAGSSGLGDDKGNNKNKVKRKIVTKGNKEGGPSTSSQGGGKSAGERGNLH